MVVFLYIQQSNLALIPCVFKNSVVLKKQGRRWAVLDRKVQYLQVMSSCEAHMAVLTLFSKFGILSNKNVLFCWPAQSAGYRGCFIHTPSNLWLITACPPFATSLAWIWSLFRALTLSWLLRQPCWIISSQAPWHWKGLIRGTGNSSAETPQLSGWQCWMSGRLAALFSWPQKLLIHFCYTRLLVACARTVLATI